MSELLDGMKEMPVLEYKVSLVSSMNEDNAIDMDVLVESVIESIK
jgi:hypothetical protein